MAVFALRFDFRNPAFAGTSMGERYAAALDMVSWAEDLGFMMVVLSEHHGSDDGYLPRPLPMAAAVASRTKNMMVNIAAIPAPLHDPLHIAEELAVVDLISQGRVSVVLANGYAAHEFDMFDRSLTERAKRTTEMVHTLRKAWTGEPFEFRGRTVRVTPTPFQPGGPAIVLGGSVEAAARRAARIADGFMPSNPGLWDAYRDERIKLGHEDPGPHFGGDTGFLHLSKDPEADWERIAPFAMHEANAYGAMMAAAGTAGRDTGGYAMVDSAEELRETGQYRVLTPEQYVEELTAMGDAAFGLFHPMMGGIPPQLAWESLKLLETEVLPNL
jgi:alkanesulfonate monooxygenase SsuD/methylene tetrahydromethanopterin reductase-like flavin-dependent oxidoreductase (luciferase family)